MIFSIDFYSLISQNQLDQNSLYKGNGSLGATGQTTKLHLILAATFKKSGGPQVKLQNYTEFECMPYILKFLIGERVNRYQDTNY